MNQVTEIHQVMSRSISTGKIHVESTWYNKADAQSVVDDMDDDWFVFYVESHVILGKPEPVVKVTRNENPLPKEFTSLLSNILTGK